MSARREASLQLRNRLRGHLPLCPPSSISAASLPPRPAVMKAMKMNNAVRWQCRAAERKDYLSCTGEA